MNKSKYYLYKQAVGAAISDDPNTISPSYYDSSSYGGGYDTTDLGYDPTDSSSNSQGTAIGESGYDISDLGYDPVSYSDTTADYNTGEFPTVDIEALRKGNSQNMPYENSDDPTYSWESFINGASTLPSPSKEYQYNDEDLIDKPVPSTTMGGYTTRSEQSSYPEYRIGSSSNVYLDESGNLKDTVTYDPSNESISQQYSKEPTTSQLLDDFNLPNKAVISPSISSENINEHSGVPGYNKEVGYAPKEITEDSPIYTENKAERSQNIALFGRPYRLPSDDFYAASEEYAKRTGTANLGKFTGMNSALMDTDQKSEYDQVWGKHKQDEFDSLVDSYRDYNKPVLYSGPKNPQLHRSGWMNPSGGSTAYDNWEGTSRVGSISSPKPVIHSSGTGVKDWDRFNKGGRLDGDNPYVQYVSEDGQIGYYDSRRFKSGKDWEDAYMSSNNGRTGSYGQTLSDKQRRYKMMEASRQRHDNFAKQQYMWRRHINEAR